MATSLLAAALESESQHSDSDRESGSTAGYEAKQAISHTGGEIEAISHERDSVTKPPGRKRKAPASESSGPSSKRSTKCEQVFTPASPKDGKVECIFVQDECIPLWPQYLSNVCEGHFLRVGARETWMLKVLLTSKRLVSRGDEQHEPKENKLSNKDGRKLAASICRDLVKKLQRAVAKAKKEKKKVENGVCPEIMTFSIEGSEVRAATRARCFHILLEPSALSWIQSGLRKAVTNHIGSKMKAISHESSKCKAAVVRERMYERNMVRDKVFWMPAKLAWGLKVKANGGAIKQYCKANSERLDIDGDTSGEAFHLQRRLAFEAACRVWNAVDQSGKRRINMEVDSGMQICAVEAMSHEKSDAESTGSGEESKSETV